MWSSYRASSGRPFSPFAKYDAAFDEVSEPNKSSEELNQKLRYFCTVGRSMAPALRMAAGSSVPSSFITSSERRTTRLMPVSPTNMWCASSVSMNEQVRASGSKLDSASDFNWNLPSRSVKYVNMKKLSQSRMGSLKVPRMRGLLASPEWRSSNSSASSRPSRPK